MVPASSGFGQRASGFLWHQDVFVDVFGRYLEGKTLGYFNAQYDMLLGQEEESLVSVMNNMY
jgi:hypothetical protein